MIVIVIVGVVYTLAVSKIHQVTEQKTGSNFANLKEYLHSFLQEDAKEAKLLCLDDCSECSVYVDGVKKKSFESFFDSSVEVYRYDFLQGTQSVEPPALFDEKGVQERVCFTLSVDRDFVADQVIVVYKDSVYDFTTYFTQTPVYDSLSAFVDAKEAQVQEVLQ